MPTSDGSPIVPGLTADLVSLRKTMFSLSAKLMEPVFLGEVDSTFGDAITVSMLVHIGTSEDETHSHVPQWLAFLKFIVRQLNLNIEPDGFDEESREERRRLWWATYVVDRHSSLSFNLRTQMTEIDCRQLRRPIPDILWDSSRPLTPRSGHGTPQGLTGVDFEVHSLDIFGIFIPIASILGEILEYHFLRQHQTFGFDSTIISRVRSNIEQDLITWMQSLRRRVAELEPTAGPLGLNDTNYDDITQRPRLALYGEHLHQCMYVLLYGKMDFVAMYNDTSWLASPDFPLAGEHAVACAKILVSILLVDRNLQLCNRYFGTYLLQSSFVFLILVKNLGREADGYIVETCSANLQALDTFVRTVNIGYQRTFARTLRRTLGGILGREVVNGKEGEIEEEDEEFDPELLKYRWIGGYSGLWFEDMGRPGEAKRRKFEGARADG